PTVYALHLYDADGSRVKKLVRRQSGPSNSAVYIDGVLVRERNGTEENDTVHVADGPSRIATVRLGPPLRGDSGPRVQFHLADHLGSGAVVTDTDGGWMNREEFTPFGDTSFGGFSRKRYRFLGRERDEESGLSYHGARYYAPWLCRWTSCDPAGP